MKRIRTRSVTKAIQESSQITIHDLPLEVLTTDILGRLNTCKMAFAFYEASRVSKLWRKIILEDIIGSTDDKSYIRPTSHPKNPIFPDFNTKNYATNSTNGFTFRTFLRKCEIAEANYQMQNLFRDLLQGVDELIKKQTSQKQPLGTPPIEKCYERAYKQKYYFFSIVYRYYPHDVINGEVTQLVYCDINIFWSRDFYKKIVQDIFDRYGMKSFKQGTGKESDLKMTVWTDFINGGINCYLTEKKPEDIFLDLNCYPEDSSEEDLYWEIQKEYFDPDVLY